MTTPGLTWKATVRLLPFWTEKLVLSAERITLLGHLNGCVWDWGASLSTAYCNTSALLLGRHGCAQQQGAAHDSEESVAAMYAACLSHCRAESMPEERVHQDQGLQTHCSFLAHSPAQHHTPCYIGSSSAYGSSLA